ncbi:MAG: hypothetical protein JWO53_23 [Chlamydiia bacterium]|nr:hypothetical protein [Chlamydiia bacterium]
MKAKLQAAKEKVHVGKKYTHYKSPDKPYLILQIALLEATEEPCVVYQALYGDELIWVRPLESFLGVVDHAGKTVPRFQLQ